MTVKVLDQHPSDEYDPPGIDMPPSTQEALLAATLAQAEDG